MNKIVSIKNTSAIFLATVLVLGTFAAISPSFIFGAQAEQYTPDEGSKSYYNEEPYSYGDSYSDDMYSEYPTKDKKFECEEGPFTGFFVSDPIFCDVELPAGPQGPAGIRGPAGPQGEPGPSQILPQNLYIVIGEAVQGSVSAQSRATCDPGDVAIAGGISGAAFEPFLQTITDRPDFSTTPPPPDYPFDTWLATVSTEATADASTFVQAYAQCFDNPPLRSPLAASAVSSVQQPEDSPTIAQGIGDSPKLSTLEKQQPNDSPRLTAIEKIAKLKQQWLNQLP